MPLPELLERAAARPVGSVDLDQIWRRGRRRRQRRQAAVGATLAAVVAAAVVVLPGTLTSDRGGVTLAPGAPSEPAQPPPATPAPPATAPPTPWVDLTLAGAIDRLVALNESAPAQEQSEGTRVTRTVSAYLNTTVDGGSAIDVTVREAQFSQDGSGVLASAPVAEGVDQAADADRLREIVAGTDLDALELDEEQFGPGELSQVDVDAALDEAEQLAAAPPPLTLPWETETERGSDAAAGIAVADALRETLPSPQQRVRALRIISSLDPAFVEYAGVVRDLLGREGIGIALLGDPKANESKGVLIFSPDTGDLRGEVSLPLTPEPGSPELYGLTAILEAFVSDFTPLPG